MRNLKSKVLALILLVCGSMLGQTSYSIPGDGNWYRIAKYGGAHAYISYKYNHRTAHNPSVSTGEILFINSQSCAIQNHHTMGYHAWGQPQFAIVNHGNQTELWIKATNGVTNSTFTITDQLNINTNLELISDNDLSNNGGSLKIYDKLRDNSHIYEGSAIFNNGKVGINTTDPKEKLDIEGNIRLHGDLKFGSEYNSILFPPHPQAPYSGGITGDDYSYKRLTLFHGHSIALKTGSNNVKSGKTRLYIDREGKIGIGTTSPDYNLDVAGIIRAEEIKVEAQTADFVFEEDYNLKDLSEVESFILTNKHLPDIPSAKEMEASGVNLAEMNKLLLQKVEELTLYTIKQNKESASKDAILKQNTIEIKNLQNMNNLLLNRLEKLETLINEK